MTCQHTRKRFRNVPRIWRHGVILPNALCSLLSRWPLKELLLSSNLIWIWHIILILGAQGFKKDRRFTFNKSKTNLKLVSLQRLKCIQEAFILSCLWLFSTFFPLSLCVLLSQTPSPARLPFWWKTCRYRVTPKSQCPYPLVSEEETSFWVSVNHASMSLAKSIITTVTTAFVAVPFVYLWIRLCSEVGDVRLDASSAHWHQDQ